MRPIDWRAPWLAPLRAVADADPPGLPVRFVPAAQLPAGEAYEAFIARTGCVPTRDNLHDHFNRLVWRACPSLKQGLNQLHAAAIADPLALSAADWARKPFMPLPVLGIPGWWPANEDPAFYADKAVFRPARA